MSPLLSWRRAAVALLLCFGLASGCSKTKVPLAPVSGKVTVDNQPVTSGQISLIPLERTAESKAGMSAGTIDSSGNYTISTGGRPGAPLGRYKVTVSPVMVPPEGATGPPTAPYNNSYQNANSSTLEIEVVKDPAEGRYDLRLTK
jgi:hypothetical protein